MKYSLICATSICALAAAGPAHADVLTSAPAETDLYDPVHVGGPLAIAAAALRTTQIDQQEAGFTGPLDRSAAAGIAFPLVPLGAAPGTPPDNDFAMQFAGAWQWNASQKALAIGTAHIAPLIGAIANGSDADTKPGSTVFVSQSSLTGFNGGRLDNRRRPAAANGFAASSTATMTVTGPANLRQRAGSGFSVTAPRDEHPLPDVSEPAPTNPALPTPSYHYAPQSGPATKGNLATASFSQAVTASGTTGMVYKPVVSANNQTGAGLGRPTSLPTSEQAATYAGLIDVTLPIGGRANAEWADGTRTFLPASVSANPTGMAARYVTTVLDVAAANQSGQTVEVFQIGQTKEGHTPDGASTIVADPLRGKIMAGAGPLDNSLALP